MRSLTRHSEQPYGIYSAPVGPFAMNQYLVISGREAALIDCGTSPSAFQKVAADHSSTITNIYLTHAHIDHVAGLADTKRIIDAPIWLHDAGQPVYANAVASGLMFGMRIDAPPATEKTLSEGDVIHVGEADFDVWHVPGHAPGHVAFVDQKNGLVFGGDVLFRGSIGRLDLPGCSEPAMIESLRRFLTLPDETVIYPGHMGPTTIGEERANNSILKHFNLT
ncbi:MAG: hydroxyacylglutathione hydrolase [Bradymonadia bacterium]|jgi:hydroxyacylglutathione hydrolase